MGRILGYPMTPDPLASLGVRLEVQTIFRIGDSFLAHHRPADDRCQDKARAPEAFRSKRPPAHDIFLPCVADRTHPIMLSMQEQTIISARTGGRRSCLRVCSSDDRQAGHGSGRRRVLMLVACIARQDPTNGCSATCACRMLLRGSRPVDRVDPASIVVPIVLGDAAAVFPGA